MKFQQLQICSWANKNTWVARHHVERSKMANLANLVGSEQTAIRQLHTVFFGHPPQLCWDETVLHWMQPCLQLSKVERLPAVCRCAFLDWPAVRVKICILIPLLLRLWKAWSLHTVDSAKYLETSKNIKALQALDIYVENSCETSRLVARLSVQQLRAISQEEPGCILPFRAYHAGIGLVYISKSQSSHPQPPWPIPPTFVWFEPRIPKKIQ